MAFSLELANKLFSRAAALFSRDLANSRPPDPQPLPMDSWAGQKKYTIQNNGKNYYVVVYVHAAAEEESRERRSRELEKLA